MISLKDILRNAGNSWWAPFFFPSILLKSVVLTKCLVADILQNLMLCPAEESNSYGFRTIWGCGV